MLRETPASPPLEKGEVPGNELLAQRHQEFQQALKLARMRLRGGRATVGRRCHPWVRACAREGLTYAN